MKSSRIKICNDATMKLRNVQGKTGLTPNVLLRFGFGLSLRDKSILDPKKYPEDGKELNRYTVTGEYDVAFVALLKEWMYRNEIETNNKNMVDYFQAHLNRGAVLLSGRVKSLVDLSLLD
jgi:DNA sulfur modification protein DndE